MVKRILLILFLWCISVSAIAQKDSLHRSKSIKIISIGPGGFKEIRAEDISTTTTYLNRKLSTISAHFYQIEDSLVAILGSDAWAEYPFGSMRNSFSAKNRLNISYFIRPNNHGTGSFYGTGSFSSFVYETNHFLSLEDSADTVKRDSILNAEYKRYISSRLTQNALLNGNSCFSKNEAVIHANYDKSILNADSVIVIQYIAPPYGTCAIGLSKDVILYKKGLGYIVLGYGLVTDWKRKISFREASNLLDELIKQTWGIIRFNKD